MHKLGPFLLEKIPVHIFLSTEKVYNLQKNRIDNSILFIKDINPTLVHFFPLIFKKKFTLNSKF